MHMQVDAIDMSYGEATGVCDRGCFIALANEVVHKHALSYLVLSTQPINTICLMSLEQWCNATYCTCRTTQ